MAVSLKALGALLLQGAKAAKKYAGKAGTYVDDLVTSGARSKYTDASKKLADNFAAELAEANTRKSISQDAFDRLRQVYNRALTGQLQTYNATQQKVVDALTTGQIEDIITKKLPDAERKILKWNSRIADINKAYKDAGDDLLKQLAKDKRTARVLAYGGTGVGLTGGITAPIVLSKSSDRKPVKESESGKQAPESDKPEDTKSEGNSKFWSNLGTVGASTALAGGLGAVLDRRNRLRGMLIGAGIGSLGSGLGLYLAGKDSKES